TFKTKILSKRIRMVPAQAKWRIGNDCVKFHFLSWVQLIEHVPLIKQCITVKNLKLRIFHPVQEHIHTSKVVRRNVFFLSVYFVYGTAIIFNLFPYIQQ